MENQIVCATLSPEQAAKYVGVSLPFVKSHIKSGRFPGLMRAGRCWRVVRAELDKRMAAGKLLLDAGSVK